ncbi:hypothetical protein M9Y10_036264 [Tritrichomonas musculus]|uniref:C2 NT-type domain-containing protein n=1 Tax=Tritrichomonas musculus TaxID=1915356 RepID=A0ABR2GUX4_9EUKA
MRGTKQYAVVNFTIHRLKIPNDTQDTFQVEFKRGSSSGLTEQALPTSSEEDQKSYEVNFEKRFRCPVTLIQGTTSSGNIIYHKKKIAFTVYRYRQSSRKVFGKLTIDVANYINTTTESFEIESPHSEKSYLVMTINVNFTNKKIDTVGLAGDDIDLASVSEAIQLTTDRQDEWDLSDAITLEKRDQIQNFFLKREREKNNQRYSLADFANSSQPFRRTSLHSGRISPVKSPESDNALLTGRRQSLIPNKSNQGLDSFLRTRPIPSIPKKVTFTSNPSENKKDEIEQKEQKEVKEDKIEKETKEDKSSEAEAEGKEEKEDQNDLSEDDSEKSDKKKKKEKSGDDKGDKKKKKKDKTRKARKNSSHNEDESDNDEPSEKKHKRKKEKSRKESDEQISQEQLQEEERKADLIQNTKVFFLSILTKQWDETPIDISKMPKTSAVLAAGTLNSNIFKDDVFTLEEFQTITNEYIYHYTSSEFVMQMNQLEKWVITLYYLTAMEKIRSENCEKLGLNSDRVDMFINALNGVCSSLLDDLSKTELDENYKSIADQIIKGKIDGSQAKTCLVEALNKTSKKFENCCDQIKNFFIDHISKLTDILLVQTVLDNPDRCTFQYAGEWNSVLTILSEDPHFQNLQRFRQTATIFMMPSMLCDDPSCKPDICPDLPTEVVYRLLKSQKVDDFWPIPNDTEKFIEHYKLTDNDLTASMSFEYEDSLVPLAKELKYEDPKTYTYDEETKMSFTFLSKYF